MAEVGALRAALSANAAQFEKDMKRARNAVRTNATGMERAMEGVRRKFGQALGAVNRYGGMVATVAAGAMVAFIRSQINAADQMGKTAQAAGTTTEFISSMGFVASQTGTSIEAITRSIQRLSMNMNDFRRGAGESREAFQDLGLTVENANGTLRNSEDVMLDIAERFKGMEDGADKTALAMRLFGRAGAELIPMLNQGRDGIEDLQRKAEEMGLVISTETAMQAAFLNDQLDELRQTAVGVGRSVALNMLPDLNEAIQVIRFAKEESGFLTAAWVALGAAGDALFTKSLTQQINETSAALEVLTDAQARGARTARGAGEFVVGRDSITHRIKELTAELETLEAQQQRREKADKDRMEASFRRSQEEADQRAAATEAMREAAAERARLEQAEQAATQTEEARTRAIDATIEALETQRDTMSMNAGEIAVYRLGILDATDAQKEMARAIYDEIAAREERNRAEAKGQEIFAATRTAQEQFRAEVEELQELHRQGHIEAETFWRAIEQAYEGVSETAGNAKDDFADLRRAIEGWGRDSANAIADFAMDGKASFSDMVNSMIRDIMRMMIYRSVMEPLFGSIGGGLGSMFGGGRANGGPVASGKMYEVNERGPELLNVGGRQFLMMGQQGGDVTPMGEAGGGGQGTTEVKVEVFNESGQAVRARNATATFDMKRMVIGVVLEGIDDNTMGLRRALGGS